METHGLTKSSRNTLGIVSPLVYGTILIQIPFANPSEGPQKVSQASPQTFYGVGVDFPKAIPIGIFGPLLFAVINGFMYPLPVFKAIVALPLIRIRTA